MIKGAHKKILKSIKQFWSLLPVFKRKLFLKLPFSCGWGIIISEKGASLEGGEKREEDKEFDLCGGICNLDGRSCFFELVGFYHCHIV